MKCNYNRTHTSNKGMKELYSALLNSPEIKQKQEDLQAQQYIMSQAFDEEDFNEMWKRYKETGELPEKRF